jgi:hypothetical protein
MYIWSESQWSMSDTKRRRGIVLVPLEPKPEAQPHGAWNFGYLLSIRGVCCPESEERKIAVKDLEVEGEFIGKHRFRQRSN